MRYQPIVIIGAPRSGTNMLRDILCRFEGVGTWPCDEINYIWRHGNTTKETDQLDSSLATFAVKQFINNEFDKIAKKYNFETIVEKTCANSLRVPFVNEVLPDAQYIFIYRNGVDAAGSAKKRWRAPLNIPYIAKKARFVPISDLPYYGFKYFWNRVYRLFSKEKRLAFWGPQFDGLSDALEKYSLEEVGALQWKKCVDLSEEALQQMPKDKVIRVKYEDFVTTPQTELKTILRRLHIDYTDESVQKATQNVSSKSIGKGRKVFDKAQLQKVTALIRDSLQRYGYE